MANTKLLITGASGHLGRRVVEILLSSAEGVAASSLIATTRNPDGLAAFAAQGVDVRKADFDDPATLERAFAGAGRVLLVSTDNIGRAGDRAKQHIRAVEAAERAGVRHVVYTSIPNPHLSPVFIAEDHARTEAALAATKLDYTILRNGLYADNLLGVIPGAVATGQLVDAKGNGAVAWVTREDCARAAAAALRAGEGRRRLDVTGPEPITSARLAEIVSRLAKKPITHASVPATDLVAGMKAHGLPELIADLYASFDVATSRGDYASVSDTVQRLTGKVPQSVESFLEANRAAFT